MYSEKEASAIKQKFWTSFGQYMAPVASLSGEKINWINYKTGIKGISLKANADNNQAFVAIEISVSDKIIQENYFKLFHTFKKQFKDIAGDGWDMQPAYISSQGNNISRISTELNQVNIFRESDWPRIITFLKEKMIAFDAFWVEYKPAFETI